MLLAIKTFEMFHISHAEMEIPVCVLDMDNVDAADVTVNLKRLVSLKYFYVICNVLNSRFVHITKTGTIRNTFPIVLINQVNKLHYYN